MPDTISTTDINTLIAQVKTGDISGAYTYLSDRGYDYASWANGVVTENTIAGVAAVNFLTDTAGHDLSEQTLQNIRQDMAKAYLDVLEKYADKNGGVTNSDINAEDVWKIHDETFTGNGLSIENWTLNTPFEIVKAGGGDAALEHYWEEIRATRGDWVDASLINARVFGDVFFETQFPGSQWTKEITQKWLDDVSVVKGVAEWLLNMPKEGLKSLLDFIISPAYGNGNEVIETVKQQVTSAKTTSSPIILDLNNNGIIETTDVKQGAYFDHANDGLLVRNNFYNQNYLRQYAA